MAANLSSLGGYLSEVYGESLRKQLERDNTFLSRFLDQRRKGHFEPPTRKQLFEFENYKLRHQRIIDEGTRTGWLPEGNFEYEFVTPHGPWVWDETEEEHAERLETLATNVKQLAETGEASGFVTFPVAQRESGHGSDQPLEG